jgi:hypothetical protein
MMQAEGIHFDIVELKTPETGGHSKRDRIDRLEPDLRSGRFYLPCVIHHPEFGGPCLWSVWTEENAERAKAQGDGDEYNVGQIIYRKMQGEGLTAQQKKMERGGMKYRIVTPLKRLDENRDIYDVTRVFIEEAIRHPFARHDDLIDATARIYDIDPYPPVHYERWSTEPLGLDNDELRCESLESELELLSALGAEVDDF